MRWAPVVALLAGACQFDRPPDIGRSVSGSLHGMWDGASATIDLVVGATSQQVVRDGDGGFAFPGDVADGSTFEIIVHPPTGHTCASPNGTGVIDGADRTDIDIECHGPRVQVELSPPIAWTFDPDAVDQPVAVSLLTTAIAVRATDRLLSDVSFAGSPVAPGAWSAPRLLEGDTSTLDLRLQAGPISRTYHLSVSRGAVSIAQMMYGKASNGVTQDDFGTSVAIDGDRLVVGAPRHDHGRTDNGAVYVYRRHGTTWTEEAALEPVQPLDHEHFGAAVAISGDRIVVGQPGNPCGLPGPRPTCEGGSFPDAGAAVVFRRAPSGWQQEILLKASQPGSGDRFGASVAIDGNRVVVGAPGEDSAATVDGDPMDDSATDAGAAYVFDFDGTNWRQSTYLKAGNSDARDTFGTAVAIDGDDVVVGAPLEASASLCAAPDPANDGALARGAAYVFHQGAPWRQVGYLKGDATAAAGQMGASVAIAGNRIVVGAPIANDNQGRAYVFERVGSTWTCGPTLASDDVSDEDAFGMSIAIRGDLIAVGAAGEGAETAGVDPVIRDDTGSFIGAVYLFRGSGASWQQVSYIKASNPQGDDYFGQAVALGDDTLCVTSPQEDSAAHGIDGDQESNAAVSSGAVYCFR